MTLAPWVILIVIAILIAWAVIRPNTDPKEPSEEAAPLRCTVKDCNGIANRGKLHFRHSEGFGDFIRRSFGAAPRYRIHEDRWAGLRYCEAHFWQAREECSLMLVQEEHTRVQTLRDAEKRLSAFERNELDRLLER